jgi:sulfonate transport system substrate-binding protein
MTSQFNISRRRLIKVVVPGLLSLSTTLVLGSCNGQTQKVEKPSSGTNVAATNISNNNSSGIKTKVLRLGYQQAGDLVRVTGVLEKRLEPLGVKVEWAQFAQGPQLMEAMNVGKVDLGSVGETPPIFAQAAGAQIVYVAGRTRNERTGEGSAIVVPPDSAIKKIEDLKGQKIVFQKASASHYFILRALEDAGLKYSDIKVVSMPNVEARDAFIQGRIPVWVTGDPHLALAEKLGKVRILKNSKGLDTTGGYYVAGRQFAMENPELLRIAIEEIDKIGQWAEANPKETAKILAPEQKLDLDVMEAVTNRRTYRLRPITPELMKDQQRIVDYFHKNGLLPKPLSVQEALLTPEQYAQITPQTISQR